MNKTERRQRNKQIAQSLAKNEPVTEIARRHHLSRTQVYRAAQSAEKFSADPAEPKLPLANLGESIRLEAAQPDTTTPRTEFASINNRDLFNQNSMTGLRRFGGRIDDDYLTIMRSFNKRIQLFREMGNDPMIASILNAITMTLRRVKWSVVISDDTPQNQEAKAFLESCMNDMSQSWVDTVDQVIRGTVQYGFQLAEVDYKKRNGLMPKGDAPQSKYEDGRIGWRKWVFIAPESLAPGREWVFDDFGGIQGFIQQPPPTFRPIPVPIQKAILFRLSLEKNNPEGKSILRPMHSAYWYKKNLEEIQAMAFERNGMGFPTFYLGNDTSKDATSSTSDISVFKNIGDNIRVDEQASLVIPYPKMGGGASPDNGVLFEFVTASGVDFKAINDAIVRYEQRLAMIGLAQFVHLGMQKIGTQALAKTIIDFFTLSISAFADMIEDSLNRYAVERLFMINSFPGITKYPCIEHERLGSETIADMADYLLKLVQGGLLTPDNDLESYLREMGDLPEKPEAETTPEGKAITVPKNNTPPDNNKLLDGEASKNQTTTPDANNPHEKMSEMFYNENHDELGRFAPGDGGESSSNTGSSREIDSRSEALVYGTKLSENALKEIDSPTISAIKEYKGEGFSDINESLRDDSIPPQSEYLDAVIEKSVIFEPITVFRGSDSSVFEQENMTNNSILEKGYVSTSLIKAGSGQYGDVLVKIHLQPGDKGLYIDKFGSTKEYEILLSRNLNFKVIKDNFPNDDRMIELEVIR